MKIHKAMVLALVLGALLLAACGAGAEAAIATGIAQTQQISALETAAAGGGAPAVEGQPSNTPGPSVAFVSVTTDTHCRSGPRLDYTLLTQINVGQPVEVLKTFSNDYAVVKNPNSSGDCWLFLKFANTIDFSAFNLPTATQPPTPKAPTATPTFTATPGFIWFGVWEMAFIDVGVGPVTITVSGNNLYGSFGSGEFSFAGTISPNGQMANGTITSTSTSESAPFQLMIKSGNHNQFIGSFQAESGTYAWCGWRPSSSTPNPCIWP